jgi:hypothetical protein
MGYSVLTTIHKMPVVDWKTFKIYGKIWLWKKKIIRISYQKAHHFPLHKSLHQSFFYSFITILPSESGVTLHYSTILPYILWFRHFTSILESKQKRNETQHNRNETKPKKSLITKKNETNINETIFFYMRQQFTKCQWRIEKPFYSFITILPSESGVTLHYSTILP